jgi:enediyne biosynthesis protein E4
MGMSLIAYPFLTWSTVFIDYDNDGWKDIFAVNGHVYPQVDAQNWGTPYAQRPYVFHNVNKGEKFELVPAVEGTGLALVVPGRGRSWTCPRVAHLIESQFGVVYHPGHVWKV